MHKGWRLGRQRLDIRRTGLNETLQTWEASFRPLEDIRKKSTHARLVQATGTSNAKKNLMTSKTISR